MHDQEPSLLDFLEDRLNIRRILRRQPPRIRFPSAEIHVQTEESSRKSLTDEVTTYEELSPEVEEGFAKSEPSLPPSALPWRILLAVFFALIAQIRLEPPTQDAITGIIFYAAATGLMVWSLAKQNWLLPAVKTERARPIGLQVRALPLFVFLLFFFASFIAFSDNRFSVLNVALWLATLVFGLLAFWEREKRPAMFLRFRNFLVEKKKECGQIKTFIFPFLVLASFALSAWFHIYNLDSVPLNMTSDHTEKLLDIYDVLNGNPHIFFMNNGGREPIHFYLSAMLVKLFGVSLNFSVLKISMSLAFLISLFYVYRLGKEAGTRWTGLIFMTLLGFSSWMNIISRVGLRVVLAPVFVAPVMFYFFRGLRTSRRNDFVLAGILSGLGLLGYSAFRLMPLVIGAGVLIFWLYRRKSQAARKVGWALGLMALFALVLVLPLLRVFLDFPEVLSYRTLSRLTSAEVPLQGGALVIFLSNFWKCLVMPFWKDGNTWVISVMDRPGLDVVSAAFFFVGLLLSFWRWLRFHSWRDLLLILSIPLLMLPSSLALAFPGENPSLSRAGGAAIPIFLMTAIALESLLASLWRSVGGKVGKSAVVALGLVLVGVSAAQNYEIALKQYPAEYVKNTWNTTQMGNVAADFIADGGDPANVWVVGVPHWVDTRLVAISAGYIGRDYAIWPDDLADTRMRVGEKLFLVKADDIASLNLLHALYPAGDASLNTNEVEGRDFFAFFVP